jgi:hypothetical protein
MIKLGEPRLYPAYDHKHQVVFTVVRKGTRQQSRTMLTVLILDVYGSIYKIGETFELEDRSMFIATSVPL